MDSAVKTAAQHTPGPWYQSIPMDTSKHFSEVIARADSGWVSIAEMPGGLPYARVEGMANVNLIAAAPEMYEALMALHQGFIDGSIKFTKKREADSDPYHRANILMTAAIAKAEGRQ